ncbi:hypothetical protein KSC_033850 [Ktedonobacter sp. SOSP1-52]|nr:hypothetical protein KSC_033850 [Ktedonobacter sp. SOSP1-52]
MSAHQARGVPSTAAREKGVPTGVNVDDAVNALFRQGIWLYEERIGLIQRAGPSQA